MGKTILSGGPLGGLEVDDWSIDSIKEFIYEEESYFYRNDEGTQAIFVAMGKKPTDINIVLGDTILFEKHSLEITD